VHFIYNLSIALYHFVLLLAAPFYQKARDFRNGRKDWRTTLKKSLVQNTDKLIWVHAASQGEYQQGLPVIKELKRTHEDVFILVTFFSPSGYEAFEESDYVDAIAYLPLDYPRNVKDFLDISEPQLALFIKYEFWYNYMIALNQRSIPLILVSSIFRSDQMFFHSMGGFYLEALKKTTHFFVQDDQSAQLLQRHGIEQYAITGDSRLDQMLTIKNSTWSDQKIVRFIDDSITMVCGSVWSSDWKYLKLLINRFKDVKFIIAPHEVSEDSLKLYNEISSSVAHSVWEGGNAQVMIIDSLGSLKFLYRYADVAYVGGALRGAVHNTVEPAVYGVPVIIAEHTKNVKFNEVVDLKNAGGLLTFDDDDQLFDIFEQLIHDRKKREQLGKKNMDYVMSRSGATEKIMAKLSEYL